MTYTVAAFYKFVPISNIAAKKSQLLASCREKGIKGTIILAEEGLNGTIAGSDIAIAEIFNQLRTFSWFSRFRTQRIQNRKNNLLPE